MTAARFFDGMYQPSSVEPVARRERDVLVGGAEVRRRHDPRAACVTTYATESGNEDEVRDRDARRRRAASAGGTGAQATVVGSTRSPERDDADAEQHEAGRECEQDPVKSSPDGPPFVV